MYTKNHFVRQVLGQAQSHHAPGLRHPHCRCYVPCKIKRFHSRFFSFFTPRQGSKLCTHILLSDKKKPPGTPDGFFFAINQNSELNFKLIDLRTNLSNCFTNLCRNINQFRTTCIDMLCIFIHKVNE